MRLTQGTFSYLPDLTDTEIAAQAAYAIGNRWALAVEFTDDPHPRNVYWEMWGQPIFDADGPGVVVSEVNRCREAFPNQYIRLSAYDAGLGRQTTALSFIVNRPPEEPGFRLARQEGPGRTLGYTVQAYATDRPHGRRYENGTGARPEARITDR
jgi:ribulose-bisphosphate carboxylase small chain